MTHLPSRLRAVLLDAGNTLLCLDFAEVSRVLNGIDIRVDPARLGRAEYVGRAAINRQVAGEIRARASGDGRAASGDRDRGATYFGTMLAAAGVSPPRMADALEAIRAANDQENLWRLIPEGAVEALSSLRARGLAVGVISNADGRVAGQLERAGLAPLLDFAIDSHVVGIEKPHPEIFRMGLERARAGAHESVYVGDMYAIDVLGARGAGIAGILVDPLWQEEADCPRIRSVAELPGLLLV